MKTVLILVLLGLPLGVHAQQKKLYALAGESAQSSMETNKTAGLFCIEKDSLRLIFDVCNRYTKDTTESVRQLGVYQQLKKAFVLKSWYRGVYREGFEDNDIVETKYTLVSIDFSKKMQVDSMVIFTKSYMDSIVRPANTDTMFWKERYRIANHPQQGLLYALAPYGISNDTTLKWIDGGYWGFGLQGQGSKKFDDHIASYFHSEGEQGLGTGNNTVMSDEIGIGVGSQGDSLIPFVKNPLLSKIKEIIYIDIPDKQNLLSLFPKFKYPTSKNGYIYIYIYNSQYIIMYSDFNWDEKAQRGLDELVIYDKAKKVWTKTPLLKGYASGSFMRIFENWLTGYEAYSFSFTMFSSMQKFQQPMSGKAYRPHENSIYGETFDERAVGFRAYLTGTLFMYNIDTQKYIEWVALENGEPQADSEIILVENNVVYYRINDKIYQREVINGEELSTPKLLVQDSRVCHIHWLFFAEE